MRAVTYVRYSSDNQRDESIEAQSRAIREYCSNNNIELVKIYADEARSATTDNRPKFLEMIKETPRLNVQCVIVHKLDRFARNRYDSAFYKKKLKENGIRLISVLERLDDSPESIILESMLEGMAEYYSKNLSREVMKGMKETALQGKHNGGIPPLGYDVAKDKTYILNEPESIIIKQIFDMYLNNDGYKNIACILNDKGYRTKLNRKFSQTSIMGILQNEKYTGTYVFNLRADGKTLKKLKHKDEIIKIEDVLPVIIEKEKFNQVQEKIESKKRGAYMRNSSRIYLLTGKLICGECGSAYTGNGYVGRNKKYIYRCTNKKNKKGCSNKDVYQDDFEPMVIEELKKSVFSDMAIDKIVAEVLKYASEKSEYIEVEKKETDKKIKELNKKIDKLFDLYLEDNLDKNILKKKIDNFKDELNIHEQKKNEFLFIDTELINEKMIRGFILNAKDNLYSEDKKLIKKVIDVFVHEIIIYNDRFELTFKVDKEESDRGKNGSDTVRFGSPPPTISLTIKR